MSTSAAESGVADGCKMVSPGTELEADGARAGFGCL